MTDPQTAARMRHLDNASRVLMFSSPAISARLQAAWQSAASETGIGETVGSIPSCTACGSTLIPGWSCRTITMPKAKRKRRERPPKTGALSKTSRRECSRCHAVEDHDVSRSSKTANLAHAAPTASNVDGKDSRDGNDAAMSGLHRSEASRKRARGKGHSLQSLLALQQARVQESQKETGLQLMDFMKPLGNGPP